MEKERVADKRETIDKLYNRIYDLESNNKVLKNKLLYTAEDLYRIKVALQYESYFITEEEIDERKKMLLDLSKITLYGHIKEKIIKTSEIDNSQEILLEHLEEYTDRDKVFEIIVRDGFMTIDRKENPTAMEELGEIHDNLNLKGKTEKERVEEIYTYILNNFTYYKLYEEDPNYNWYNYAAFGGISGGDELQCVGYTSLFSHLLLLSGIESKGISSEIKDSEYKHAWNEVTLSTGEVYYFDLTWADDKDNLVDSKYLWSKEINFNQDFRYNIE